LSITQNLLDELARFLASPDAFSPINKSQLRGHLAHQLRAPISDKEWTEAIAYFKKRGELKTTSTSIVRSEPDCAEKVLEKDIESFFGSNDGLGLLRYDPSLPHLFVNTSRMGTKQTGKNSIPDFTLIQKRHRKYGDGTDLYATTIELKNRRGANNHAILETANHRQFAHRSYLVMPHSQSNPELMQRMEDDARFHKIGLIYFDLAFDGRAGRGVAKSFRKVVEAPEAETQTKRVEDFIDARHLGKKVLAL
jgi:hypothetical protein